MCARVIEEMRSWIGTPFFEGIGAKSQKKVACDCVGFPAKVLSSVGGIGLVHWPKRYVSSGGGHHMLEVLINTLNGIPNLHCIWTRDSGQPLPEVKIADVLVASSGEFMHHLGLYAGDNRVLHCWQGQVREANLKDSMLAKFSFAVYRVRHVS